MGKKSSVVEILSSTVGSEVEKVPPCKPLPFKPCEGVWSDGVRCQACVLWSWRFAQRTTTNSSSFQVALGMGKINLQ